MTIYQLECFIAVAEELNFSAAAERLFTTQPAITYQINARSARSFRAVPGYCEAALKWAATSAALSARL